MTVPKNLKNRSPTFRARALTVSSRESARLRRPSPRSRGCLPERPRRRRPYRGCRQGRRHRRHRHRHRGRARPRAVRRRRRHRQPRPNRSTPGRRYRWWHRRRHRHLPRPHHQPRPTDRQHTAPGTALTAVSGVVHTAARPTGTTNSALTERPHVAAVAGQNPPSPRSPNSPELPISEPLVPVKSLVPAEQQHKRRIDDRPAEPVARCKDLQSGYQNRAPRSVNPEATSVRPVNQMVV
jgi:hypothetical protein